MNRLTRRSENGVYIMATDIQKAFEKLADYEDAEEEGKLVIPPVKAGDTVYGIFCNEVYPKAVTRIEINPYTKPQLWISTKYEFSSGITERIDMALGKTVFLTKEEAEAALEKMKGEKHE